MIETRPAVSRIQYIQGDSRAVAEAEPHVMSKFTRTKLFTILAWFQQESQVHGADIATLLQTVPNPHQRAMYEMGFKIIGGLDSFEELISLRKAIVWRIGSTVSLIDYRFRDPTEGISPPR